MVPSSLSNYAFIYAPLIPMFVHFLLNIVDACSSMNIASKFTVSELNGLYKPRSWPLSSATNLAFNFSNESSPLYLTRTGVNTFLILNSCMNSFTTNSSTYLSYFQVPWLAKFEFRSTLNYAFLLSPLFSTVRSHTLLRISWKFSWISYLYQDPPLYVHLKRYFIL